MANIKMTESLQTVLTELLRQADGHLIQSRIFAGMGYGRLADKYAECAEAERGLAVKCIDRLLALGCEVRLESRRAGTVYNEPADCLKHDAETAKACLARLKGIVADAREDMTVYDILKAYYSNEEEKMYWMQWQLDQIEYSSVNDWLARQK